MTRRRFIAGATCPQCGAIDKIVRVEDGEHIHMECIACGMIRNLDEAPPRDQPTDAPAIPQVITIHPLKK
ncbi:MAG: hypothetical protein CVV10_00430 [Gammaproteobacteria bacterium HGW-Gammaproteobacteria-14]|nr:MAG: hypothetical protein CVV10_00430 [Gammaproteobacteria bacterium HGW-Gammaproteobacteria-14]